MNLVDSLKRITMEGIFGTMLFFLGLKALLKSKDKDMGKRGKRKNKYRHKSDNEQELEDYATSSAQKSTETKARKPFENIKLPPPRDAQDGTGRY